MNLFAIAISSLIGMTIYILWLIKYCHMMQLEGYKNNQFLGWIGKNIQSTYHRNALAFAVLIVVWLSVRILIPGTFFEFVLTSITFAVAFLMSVYHYYKKKHKKPLVFTNRMTRLFCTNILLIICESAVIIPVFYKMTALDEAPILWFALGILLLPINMIISNTLVLPIEKWRSRHYINQATSKIADMQSLIKIGITGSFGKTSTKFILATILSEKYKVLVTPDSYNTTMGTTKVITEMLDDSHQVFISEMGARNTGDIKEICSIVKPDVGIITSIGKQHLETFKTIENIANTKYELVEGLKPGGIAVFPSDNKYCYELYEKINGKKVLYGIDEHTEKADFIATNISVSENGSSFEIKSADGSGLNCTTKLLGKHNVMNILACVAIAKNLGLSWEEILRGINKVEPVPHRLQIIPTGNGTIVIDDAFNSNPSGTKMALEILGKFNGRKIIVTPGMVELGDEEYQLNKEFGRDIAELADIAILVGIKRSIPIKEGLVEAGFSTDFINVVANLEEATGKLAGMVKQGDIILFENDLPDNYDEK